MKELKEQLTGMVKKTSKIDNKLEEQEKKLNKIEECCEECRNWKIECDLLKVENIAVKKRLTEIESEIDRQEIRRRRNTVEIFGIPKRVNERPIEIIKIIAEAVKVKIQEADVEECFRAKDINGRERPITLKFKDSDLRNKLVKYVKDKKLRLGDVSMEPENKKIYVNEALIPKRKKLLFMVKHEARERGWKAVWTYKGDIYVKLEDNGSQIKVNNVEELEVLVK